MKPITAYEKIMNQNGLADLKALVNKWEALSGNMSNKPMGVPIILPDIFLVSHSGTGRTHFLKLLSEYLSDKPNLMDFYGGVKFFEFMLNYCEPHAYFTEIQRLMTEISNAAGFRSEYRGIVYIDIDDWRGHYEERHFISFMEYLSDNSDDWLVVLSVSDDDKEQVEQLEAFVSAYIRLERISIEQPTAEELMGYAKRLLVAYGITLKEDAETVITESIKALSGNKYFDGYKTVKMLCEDISYEVYTQGVKGEDGIPAESLSKFAKDSDYMKRMIVNIEKAKKIGF